MEIGFGPTKEWKKSESLARQKKILEERLDNAARNGNLAGFKKASFDLRQTQKGLDRLAKILPAMF